MTVVMVLSPIHKCNHPPCSLDILNWQDCHDDDFEKPTLIQKQVCSTALHKSCIIIVTGSRGPGSGAHVELAANLRVHELFSMMPGCRRPRSVHAFAAMCRAHPSSSSTALHQSKEERKMQQLYKEVHRVV